MLMRENTEKLVEKQTKEFVEGNVDEIAYYIIR